jgi:diguanylate cyclase (GGDEF)-like protein
MSVDEFVRSLLGASTKAPLIVVGTVESSIHVRESMMAMGAFDYFCLPDEIKLLVTKVKQLVSMSLDMDQLRADADRDYLTGLSNRRRFRTALGKEVERWRRYKQPCSLLLVDLDHLKHVNDKFGHSAGDLAIRHVATLLTDLSRDNDTAARLGGEEFALLLAGTDEKNAMAAAERLRSRVSAQRLDGVGVVTVSVGVASCPGNATSERDLYAASDAALYRAKGEGRDRCCVAAGPGDTSE